MIDAEANVLANVLANFSLQLDSYRSITHGHLHQTFDVTATNGETLILQRMNPVFSPEIHVDIQAITAHLQQQGLTVPRLLPTTNGKLWHQDLSNQVWRLQTKIAGITYQQAPEEATCFSAGQLLGTWHRHLQSCQHRFVAPRWFGHDTLGHLQKLTDAVAQYQHHPAWHSVKQIHSIIEQQLQAMTLIPLEPRFMVHGDPKLNNFIFQDPKNAIALVDLDTLGTMPILFEIGDALRSWCNVAGESATMPQLRLDYWQAALTGYASGVKGILPQMIWQAIPDAVVQIGLELSSRFARDAVVESYFGWDPKSFPSRSAHNLQRAQNQLQLAQAVLSHRQELQNRVINKV